MSPRASPASGEADTAPEGVDAEMAPPTVSEAAEDEEMTLEAELEPTLEAVPEVGVEEAPTEEGGSAEASVPVGGEVALELLEGTAGGGPKLRSSSPGRDSKDKKGKGGYTLACVFYKFISPSADGSIGFGLGALLFDTT